MNRSSAPFRLALLAALAAGLPGPALERRAGAQGVESTSAVSIETFGLGGVWRSGAVAPIQLSVNYSGARPIQPALVVWEQRDGDGDIAEFSQVVALNPGRNVLWLYLPTRFGANASSIWDVIVYDYTDDRRGAQLAATRVRPPSAPRDPDRAIIGVVGLRNANLSDYIFTGQNREHTPLAHEATEILSNLQVEQLPDRWMGLSMLEALVWTQGEPVRLSIDQARAIEEWVERGGHLVIVLPQVGEEWKSSRLDPILPDVIVQRIEGLEVRDNASSGGLLRHLGRIDAVTPDTREPRFPIINLHTFLPVGADWSQGTTIPLMEINLPAPGTGVPLRRAVVVQKARGYGRVTLVGIPVADVALNRPGLNLPEGEVFWNHILGRRQDTPSAAEFNAAASNWPGSASRARNPAPISSVIPQEIRLSAAAGKGLLLALVLFIVYWGVSGPLAFTLLRYRNLSRYNWPVFLGITVVFTVMSWLGASALRSNEILPVHLTFLDHVADSPLQRSTSYLTVALSGYGDRLIDVRPSATPRADDVRHNFVASLSVPNESVQQFPDVRRYLMNSADQSHFRSPARSTSKSLYVSALHAPADGWSMPTFTRDEDRPRIDEAGMIRGVVTHRLPGTLRDVTVYYVSNTYSDFSPRPGARQRGSTRLRTYAWKDAAGAAWPPGKPLDFSALAGGSLDLRSLATHPTLGYFGTIGTDAARPHAEYGRSFYNAREVMRSLEALTFFHQLNPPAWAPPTTSTQPQFYRTLAREADLSAWMVRPCVIITGFLDGSPIPYPLRIDGTSQTRADPRSVTMVRWVYPLAVDSQPQHSSLPESPDGR